MSMREKKTSFASSRRATDIACRWAAIMAILTLIAAIPAAPPAIAASVTPLVPVRISPRRRQLIGLKLATVVEKPVTSVIAATGMVKPDEQGEGYVQTRFAGWIRRVFVNQTWQYVTKGEPLFTIYGPEIASAEREYLIALDAAKQLGHSDVAGVAEGSRSLLAASLERLRLFGVSPGEIARLKRERTARDAVAIDSPMSGYVIDWSALPNQYVEPSAKLYTIASLATVWVYAAIFQNQLGQVKVGDPVTMTVDAYPGRIFHGRVDFIWPALNPVTRTARVRCAFSNRAGLLKLGMYVSVVVHLDLGRALVIPDSGVLRTGKRNIVFVDSGGGYLRPVDVILGPHAGDEFVVLKGLKAGERIVSSANFLIDSESQIQAALGTFSPPPPGAGATSAAASGAIDIATDPSPPRKGNNRLTIRVRDSSGRAVSGAEVTVIFSMAAMPAMAMPATRVEVRATPEAGGRYAAVVKLPNGGVWQVTAVATVGGKQVAARQMSVSATGGM